MEKRKDRLMRKIVVTDFDWFNQIDGHLEANVYGQHVTLCFTPYGLLQLLKVAAIWGFCAIPGKLVKKGKES